MDHSKAGKLGYEKTKSIHDAHREERSRKLREEYAANPKFCLFCGTQITFERRRAKFCNSTCSAKYNNRGNTYRRNRSTVCQCGNEKKLQNKYCSECAEKHVYLRPGVVELLKDSVAIKRLLIEQRGHRCEDCGLTEWKCHPIPLEMHHIDGNSDNNTAENLRLVCPNCHAFTAHYKGAVKGKNGSRQRRRRQKYSEGKAW